MPVPVRLLGDTHGNMTPIRLGARLGLRMIHLGDLGFRASWLKASRIPNLHVIAGNHDDIVAARETPIYLGDFGNLGEHLDGVEGVFFLRGAQSIDRDLRVEGRDWWAEEELSDEELEGAIALYSRMRPRVVLSHESPSVVGHMLLGADLIPSRTATALWRMLQLHEPERWYFGHHHVSWQRQVGNTSFRCLAIDEALDVDIGG